MYPIGPFLINSYDSAEDAVEAFKDRSLSGKVFTTKIDPLDPKRFFSEWFELLRLLDTLTYKSNRFSISRVYHARHYFKMLNTSSPFFCIELGSGPTIEISTNIESHNLSEFMESVVLLFWQSMEDYRKNVTEMEASALLGYLYNQNNTSYIKYDLIKRNCHWTAIEDLSAPYPDLCDLSPTNNQNQMDSYYMKFYDGYLVSIKGCCCDAIQLSNARYDPVLHTILCYDKAVMRINRREGDELIVEHICYRDDERMERKGLNWYKATPQDCIVERAHRELIRYKLVFD